MTDQHDLEVDARLAALEERVGYLMDLDGAVAAWLHFRRLADRAYDDIRKIQEAHGADHDGVNAFMDRHLPPGGDAGADQ